jgi:hypothetical protein
VSVWDLIEVDIEIGLEEIVRYKRTLTGAVELITLALLKVLWCLCLGGHWLGRVVERCSTTVPSSCVVEGCSTSTRTKGTIRERSAAAS